MPVTTTDNQVSGQLSELARVFAVSFPFFADSDLKVLLTNDSGEDIPLVAGNDYIVSGGDGSGGSVEITNSALTTGTITIVREVPLTQTVDLEEGDPLPSSSLERALDKLTVLVQQLRSQLQRSVRVGETSSELVEVQGLADSVFGLNAAGELLVRDRTALLALLNLPETVVDFPTKTWADDSARATFVPDFTGQVGLQQDTGIIYYANGTSAGDWNAVPGGAVPDGSISSSKLADAAVTAAKLGDDAVDSNHLADGAVGNAALANDVVGLAELAHSFGNDRLIGTNSGGSPEAKDESDFRNRMVQRVSATLNGPTTITDYIPSDNTIPQNTEGGELITCTITPTDANNKLLIEFMSPWTYVNGSTNAGVMALFQDSSVDALQASSVQNQEKEIPWAISYEMTAGTTNATTFKIRVGVDNPSATQVYFNRRNSADLGEIVQSILSITEIHV